MYAARVSVITPCYNAQNFIAATIESVLAQSFQDWEQIVVDDGSSDRSAKIIDSFAAKDCRVKTLKQKNSGMLSARVNGCAAAQPSSEYLLFLDADDLIAPEMLGQMVRYLDDHPEAGIAHCKFDFIDENGRTVEDSDRLYHRYVSCRGYVKALSDDVPVTPLESLCWWSSLTPSATVIRRASFDEVGGWDEPLGYAHEDADLFMRISLKHPVHLVPHLLASYRLHASQMTKKHLFLQREHLKFHKKWLHGAHLSPDQRHRFRRTWFYYEGWLAPQFWARRSIEKVFHGDLKGGIVCFARIWKHLAMALSAPARNLIW